MKPQTICYTCFPLLDKPRWHQESLNYISSSCQVKPWPGGETRWNQLSSVCCLCVSPPCTVREDTISLKVQRGVGWKGSQRKAWSSSKYLSYHAHMRMHSVSDTFLLTPMKSQGDSSRKFPNHTSVQMDFYLSHILLPYVFVPRTLLPPTHFYHF